MIIDPSVPFTITAPASYDGYGAVAVLNDPTSSNFVGYIVEMSGFDSPEVRESADDIPEGDGGIHGTFYYGRRPFTIDVLLHHKHPSLTGIAALNANMKKLAAATNAMRRDGTVVWTETGAVDAKYLYFRRNQPLRFNERRVLFSGVSARPEIVTAETGGVNAYGDSPSVTNSGTARSYPRIRFNGVQSNSTVSFNALGLSLTYTGTLTTGQYVDIDLWSRTVTKFDGSTTINAYGNLTTAEWWWLPPGAATTITSTGAGAGGWTLYWRHAYI